VTVGVGGGRHSKSAHEGVHLEGRHSVLR
jgi:hypothetical protein